MLAKQQADENPIRCAKFQEKHTALQEGGTVTIPALYSICHARVAHTKQHNAAKEIRMVRVSLVARLVPLKKEKTTTEGRPAPSSLTRHVER